MMDNAHVNLKNADAVQEVTNATTGKKMNNKMKRNGIVKEMKDMRMKKVSVEMKKMRKERWSLDTGGSSGDEGGRY